MLAKLLIALGSMLGLNRPATMRPANIPPDDTRLLAAIQQVESHGNDWAIGDSGHARGPYQIHEAYWRDACEFGGVYWHYRTDAFRLDRATRVVRWYWQRYAPPGATDEVKARIHNGGPRGHLNPATRSYWRNVQRELERTR